MSELRFDGYANRIRKLAEFQTLQDFKLQLNGLVTDICRFVEKNRETDNSRFREQSLEFFNAHYRDSDLSLGKIADHFELSVSYTGKLIKDVSGKTYRWFTH